MSEPQLIETVHRTGDSFLGRVRAPGEEEPGHVRLLEAFAVLHFLKQRT